VKDAVETVEAARPTARVRCARAAIAAGAAGLAVGCFEASHVLFFSDHVFERPWRQLAGIELRYALVAGLVGALVAWLRPRRCTARTAALVAGLAVGLVLFVWLESEWRSSAGAPAVVGTNLALALVAGLVAASAAASFGRRTGGRALVFVALFAALVHAAVLLWVPVAGRGTSGPAPPVVGEVPPNVVVLVVDTLRADRLSCYGYDRPTSPRLDALAERGCLFESAWAQAPWTRPSVASILTSLYPSSHDTTTQWDRLPRSVPTVAELLHARGYETAAFSANMQVSPFFGFGRGFETFWNSGTYTLRRFTAFGRIEHGVKRWLAVSLAGGLIGKVAGDERILRGTEAESLNARILDWAAERDRGRPAFLYVQYLAPHRPYTPPEDLINDGELDPVALHAEMDVEKERKPYPLESYPPASDEARDGLSRLYDAEIRYCDRELGRLIDRLGEEGVLDERSWLVVTSDHGEEFYDHEQWLHGNSLFEELVGVPLIVVGPGIEGGRRVSDPVELVDLLPTICDWAGAEVSAPVHGASLTPYLEGLAEDEGWPGAGRAYAERPGEPTIRALRTGSRKLIHIDGGPDGGLWLEYDLARDPRERTNLATTEPDPELRRLLEEMRTAAGAFLGERAGDVELEGDVADTLRALGYIGDD